jgi:phosphoglycolate phosphatase/putative hydrolase of the HAD superfamily
VDCTKLRLVVFDLDGTLYDQRCLRMKMIPELVSHCFRRPADLGVLRQIAEFRRQREALAEEGAQGIGQLQYDRPAERLGIPAAVLRQTVETWILERPLRHLRRCRFASVERYFDRLRRAGKTIAVMSDYPIAAKLRALELEADYLAAADHPEIERLKPDPAGLLRILEWSGVPPEQCLMIGDRDDRDGECARRAGVRFLLKARRRPAAPGEFSDFGKLTAGIEEGGGNASPGTVE